MSNEATFTPVNSQGELKGELIILRPSKLAEDGVTGVVAQGTYEGSMPNKFNPESLDYKIRSENGDLIIINGTGGLRQQLAKVAVGTLVQIQYNGKTKIAKGKMAGKLAHSFVVLTADSDAVTA